MNPAPFEGWARLMWDKRTLRPWGRPRPRPQKPAS